MNFSIREGSFDVVILAGPRVEHWPSPGIRALSLLCAKMGLTVGQFGGEGMKVRGVIPLPSTGGIAWIEDGQNRIHRIRARAIIRVIPESFLPEPFGGWYSAGLIPYPTARRLLEDNEMPWEGTTIVLGSGNRALKFGTSLLENKAQEVLCIESFSEWGAKRFSGWEVEKRNFEMNGGKLLEAKPSDLQRKGPLRWQLKVQDTQGIRVLDAARIVSVGPFAPNPGVREHPPGSFLYELEQTAPTEFSEHVEGWVLEEERALWLAGKIARSLVQDLGSKREELSRLFRRSRSRLRRYMLHREHPYTPSYQGKWLSVSETKRLRAFSGVPASLHLQRPIASVECFEEIPCQICQDICPTKAIQIGKIPRSKNPILNESACTACGLCVKACPSASIPLIHEREKQSLSVITLTWRGSQPWSVGESAILLNRKGDILGSGRVVGVNPSDGLVQVEIPSHLLWEARALKRNRPHQADDQAFLAAVERSAATQEKVEILLNGEKRWVRERISISSALFEAGHLRPSDILLCPDGSCRLCQISVDGITKLACQTKIHRGMSIRLQTEHEDSPEPSSLCPCLGVSKKDVIERVRQGKLKSPEAVLAVTHVGEGKCHGQLCMPSFIRTLQEEGMAISQWIDWRFPWADWQMNRP